MRDRETFIWTEDGMELTNDVSVGERYCRHVDSQRLRQDNATDTLGILILGAMSPEHLVSPQWYARYQALKAENEQLKRDNAQLQYALEQSEAKWTALNAGGTKP